MSAGCIEGDALERELREERGRDFTAHLFQPVAGLMAVIVPGAAIDLANACGLCAAKDFSEHGHLQPPTGMELQSGGEGGIDGHFTGERVAKREEEIEQRPMA